MKVDRSVLSNNDQQIGNIADPNKLEDSIKHLADVIDSNDDQKTDKTGDHQGTWKGLTPGEAAEPINGARLNAIEPEYVRGGGKTIQVGNTDTITFPANQTMDTVITFPKAFSELPTVLFSVYGDPAYNYYLCHTVLSRTTTSMTIRTRNSSTGGAGYSIFHWEAIGK